MNATAKLWPRILEATHAARASGALQPIATDREIISDGGISFVVHIIRHLAKKKAATGASPRNPFLPYDPKLFVADIPPHHVGLLNKYNVADHHLLIVTREFARQDEPLQLGDWQAWSQCFSEFPGLGFYNSGPTAGASQPHKHLQVIPLPNDNPYSSIPAARWISAVESTQPLANATALPFEHRVAKVPTGLFRSSAAFASHLYETCRGFDTLVPYNLLVTRDWVLYVPRRAECFQDISLNAMAFVGLLLVHNREQLTTLRQHGPLAALRAVTFPSVEPR